MLSLASSPLARRCRQHRCQPSRHPTTRGDLDLSVLAQRLLLAVYAYGTNTGIRAVAARRLFKISTTASAIGVALLVPIWAATDCRCRTRACRCRLRARVSLQQCIPGSARERARDSA